MPPLFPHFEPLSHEHRETVERITNQFPPYSDFNFTSLYCWNTANAVAYSTLFGNLIIRFTDYITGEPFYSFLGTENVNETVHALLEQMAAEGRKAEIKLVPESSVQNISPERFVATADEDNFDYILSIERLKTYAGNKLGGKRNFVNRFKKAFQFETRLLHLRETHAQQLVTEMFLHWISLKGLAYTEAENEHKAISRAFTLAQTHELIVPGIFIEGNLAGFTMNECLPNGYAILHFEKADAAKYIGIYQALMMETARILSERGCHYLNYEQDLGIPGLKTAKASFDPHTHLRKFRISRMAPGNMVN